MKFRHAIKIVCFETYSRLKKFHSQVLSNFASQIGYTVSCSPHQNWKFQELSLTAGRQYYLLEGRNPGCDLVPTSNSYTFWNLSWYMTALSGTPLLKQNCFLKMLGFFVIVFCFIHSFFSVRDHTYWAYFWSHSHPRNSDFSKVARV